MKSEDGIDKVSSFFILTLISGSLSIVNIAVNKCQIILCGDVNFRARKLLSVSDNIDIID